MLQKFHFHLMSALLGCSLRSTSTSSLSSFLLRSMCASINRVGATCRFWNSSVFSWDHVWVKNRETKHGLIFLNSIQMTCNLKQCFFISRFSYDGRWKQKLQTSVDFPLETLDLSQYVIGPKNNLKRYNLFSVSVSNHVTFQS